MRENTFGKWLVYSLKLRSSRAGCQQSEDWWMSAMWYSCKPSLNQRKLSKAKGLRTWGATGVKTTNQKSAKGEVLKFKGSKGVCHLRL